MNSRTLGFLLGVALVGGALWLAVDGLGTGGLAMVLLVWLSLAGLSLGGGVGGWVGWHWAGLAVVRENPGAGVPTCQACGYNLTGLLSTRCPECGHPTEVAP